MARRTKPAEPGCPVRRRNLLPVLNWHRSRKEVNRELHAMKGNTSSSVAPSHARNVIQRVDPANDDDMDLSLAPTIVVPLPFGAGPTPNRVQSWPMTTARVPYWRTQPVGSQPARTHTALEDRLECLFAQGAMRAASCALKRTLTRWASSRPRRHSRGTSSLRCPLGRTDRLCFRLSWEPCSVSPTSFLIDPTCLTLPSIRHRYSRYPPSRLLDQVPGAALGDSVLRARLVQRSLRGPSRTPPPPFLQFHGRSNSAIRLCTPNPRAYRRRGGG